MKKLQFLFLLFIFLGALVVRLYHFNNPVADWHSWRQADTSAVSRNFVKYGFDLMHPRIDNISNVQSGLDNPQGYFFAEFPIYNLFQAGGYVLFDTFTIEEWGRLISIFASLTGMAFVYLLTRKHANTIAALAAIFFYAFLPYAIYYGRTILPDSLGIAFLLGGIYCFDIWVDKNGKRISFTTFIIFIVSIILTASALLVRPHVICFFPVFIWIVWKEWGIALFKKWQIYLFAFLSLFPFVLWRLWMTRYPEGIPASAWLFNEGNIRFTGAFFYWLFAERLSKLILGYWGITLLVLGLLWKGKKDWGFFAIFFLSSLIYFIVIARGNVQHDYYQYITIPSIVMFLGRGTAFLLQPPKELVNKWISYAFVGVISIFSLAFSWYYVRDYFNINNEAIVRAGKIVDSTIPKNAKILASYNGDSSFLYQTNRFGWASFEKPLPEMITKLKADYLIIPNPKPSDYDIGKQYRIVSANTDYILFDLRQK